MSRFFTSRPVVYSAYAGPDGSLVPTGTIPGISSFEYKEPIFSIDPIWDEIRQYEEPEPKGGWVVPPTCHCDMNLCECNTPDPGYSFEEYQREALEYYANAVGLTATAAIEAVRHIAKEFERLSLRIAKVMRQTLDAQERTHRPRHAGPPPPPKPVLPMRSVHDPPAYNRAARGPR